MVRRLYVSNYRCLDNFTLPISEGSSTLLIGSNGAGKTTISNALEILQKIARGTNQVSELVKPRDFGYNRVDVPMRFELEVQLDKTLYAYTVAFEQPNGRKELRVHEEKLVVDGTPFYTRQSAKVVLYRKGQTKEAVFSIDWHLVALPIIQQSSYDSLSLFKEWLGRIIILAPVPMLIKGLSDNETLQPNRQVTDFAAWFSGLLAHAPSAYTTIDTYLRSLMSDLRDIKNPSAGVDSRSLVVSFTSNGSILSLPFGDLSDGEKCFMICALVLAADKAYGPLLCFWDEPDNYLALSEISHFIVELRKAFMNGGQLIATSHNPEVIRQFSEENTLVLHRRSHLEPTIVRALADLKINGDLVNTLIRGDLEV